MAELFCDICGRKQVVAQILLEGAKMFVCANCSRSGKIIHRFEDSASGMPQPIVTSNPKELTDEEIVENPGKLIRIAREKTNLTIIELAKKISEKASYVDAIESERVSPSLEIAKKLEKELHIKLIEKGGKVGDVTISNKKFVPLTLGDMLEPKKEKKK